MWRIEGLLLSGSSILSWGRLRGHYEGLLRTRYRINRASVHCLTAVSGGVLKSGVEL